MRIRGVLRRCALYTALLTVGVAQPMLQLYGSNPAVFTAADVSGTGVFVFAAVVLVGPPFALLLIDLLAGMLPSRACAGVRNTLVLFAALPFGLLLVPLWTCRGGWRPAWRWCRQALLRGCTRDPGPCAAGSRGSRFLHRSFSRYSWSLHRR